MAARALAPVDSQSWARSHCECDAAQQRQQLIEMLTLLLVPIDHLEGLVAFEERRQLESPNPMLLGVRPCRRQAGSGVSELALRRLLSAPDHASGCPRLRPASDNQPLGRRWPAIHSLCSGRPAMHAL